MNSENRFSIRDIMKTAWHNVKGAKWAIWAPLLIMFVIYALLGIIFGLIVTFTGIIPRPGTPTLIGFYLALFLFEIVIIFAVTPLIAGMQMVALKRTRNETVTSAMGLQYWPKWLPLGLTVLLFTIGNIILNQFLGILLGFSVAAGIPILAILIGIAMFCIVLLYLGFFIFNVLSVADKNKGPWAALGYSAKIVAPHWFRVWVLMLFLVIVGIIIALPGILGFYCPVDWVKILGALGTFVLMIWGMPYINLIIATTFERLTKKTQENLDK